MFRQTLCFLSCKSKKNLSSHFNYSLDRRDASGGTQTAPQEVSAAKEACDHKHPETELRL